jgi:hypothetical protein
MGVPGRGREGLTLKDLICSREDYGDNNGEEMTMIRQYLLRPEKYLATNGYQRALSYPTLKTHLRMGILTK